MSPSHMDAHGENSWQHTSQPAVVTSLPFFPGEKYLESSEISAVLFFWVCVYGGWDEEDVPGVKDVWGRAPTKGYLGGSGGGLRRWASSLH